MLIKDPYLSSNIKNRSFSAINPHQNVPEYNEKQNYQPNRQYQRPQTKAQKPGRLGSHSVYQKQLQKMSEAYNLQQKAIQKMSSYQSINQQYNQAIKRRNYELNTKMNDLTYQKSLLAKRHQEQIMRNTYDKDLILNKYQEQNNQILRLKRTVSELIEHKARLQADVQHLMFNIEKDSHQGSLQIKEQLIRMENMQRTLRNIIDTKDKQITQLRHRLQVYEDQNRRLNDLNRTLTITRTQKIDNLSKIDNMDSHMKSPHQIQNLNKRDDYLMSELKQQKQINEKLMNQINSMKVKLFQQPKSTIPLHGFNKQANSQLSRGQIMSQIDNLSKLRVSINDELMQTYKKSIKQAQRQKRNSLLIFIQKYKHSKLSSLQTKARQYTQHRQNLKQSHKSSNQHDIKQLIQIQLPLKLSSRTHSKQSDMVLSTMQFTKNQRNQGSVKAGSEDLKINNQLLYLFRLLTIRYRNMKNQSIKTKGASQLDQDVSNQLLHSIVKALQNLLQIQ